MELIEGAAAARFLDFIIGACFKVAVDDVLTLAPYSDF
jgi:hypothetical protein